MESAVSIQRLIAKVLREFVATERFASYADLKDALRRRLVRLRIRRYEQGDFDHAITVVASNTALVGVSAAPRRDPVPPVLAVDRHTAGDLVAQLKCGSSIKTMGNTDADDAAHEARVRDQAATMRRAAERTGRPRRRPLRDRLDEIFSHEP